MSAGPAAVPAPAPEPVAERRVTVVVATRDRLPSLLRVLDNLRALPEQPPVIVVDDGSREELRDAVRGRHPDVEVVRLPVSHGAAARNAGVERAGTPYVAFCDDDSWWAPGALRRAADALDAHPQLGLVAARVLVGDDERLDPTCAEMARSPLPPDPRLPGRPVLGFVACGVALRRSSFLEAGGFERRFGIGGEEELLSLDLAAAGWKQAYLEDVVAHHHPENGGDSSERDYVELRNGLWSAWLRRPLGSALRRTAQLLARHRREPWAAAALRDALRGLPWVARERRPVPASVEAARRRLDH